MESNTIWVFSKVLTQRIDTNIIFERNKRIGIAVKEGDFLDYKQALMKLKQGNQNARVCIFDSGRLGEGEMWAFVRDGINRAGSNPLRKLGTSPGKQFVDVSNLYRLPEGEDGIVINSLGERFSEERSLGVDSCGDMQELAIIAHELDFRIFGIVLSVAENWDISNQLFYDLGVKYGL